MTPQERLKAIEAEFDALNQTHEGMEKATAIRDLYLKYRHQFEAEAKEAETAYKRIEEQTMLEVRKMLSESPEHATMIEKQSLAVGIVNLNRRRLNAGKLETEKRDQQRRAYGTKLPTSSDGF